MDILTWIINHLDEAIAAALMLVGLAAIVARWTPTQADDKWVERVSGVIHWVAQNKTLIKAKEQAEVKAQTASIRAAIAETKAERAEDKAEVAEAKAEGAIIVAETVIETALPESADKETE